MNLHALRAEAQPMAPENTGLDGKWIKAEFPRLEAKAEKLSSLLPGKLTTDHVGYNIAYWEGGVCPSARKIYPSRFVAKYSGIRTLSR